MIIDPAALASITSAIALLGSECVKGIASEAGKSAWNGIKSLLGWTSDPSPAEVPEKVSNAISASPEIAEKLLHFLKSNETGVATAMVGKIEASGGKIVVANTTVATTFTM